jgi:hypothetical protein
VQLPPPPLAQSNEQEMMMNGTYKILNLSHPLSEAARVSIQDALDLLPG